MKGKLGSSLEKFCHLNDLVIAINTKAVLLSAFMNCANPDVGFL